MSLRVIGQVRLLCTLHNRDLEEVDAGPLPGAKIKAFRLYGTSWELVPSNVWFKCPASEGCSTHWKVVH